MVRICVVFLLAVLVPWSVQAQESARLAEQARAVLKQHCYECHGQNPKRPKGALNLFERSHLDDAERAIVVAKKPNESELMKRIVDGTMPPKERPRLAEAEKTALRDWIAAGGPAFAAEKATEDQGLLAQRAARVKEIFRVHCLECHGGTKKQGGVTILDHALLLRKRKVIPGKVDESLLYQLLTTTDRAMMPPPGQPRLSQEAIDTVRLWISEGAPAFPPDAPVPAETGREAAFKGVSGIEYVLKEILRHVRGVPVEERRFKRYFSINHILTAGATADELALQGEALAKALNHLTWEPRLVRPVAVDEAVRSVFVVDLRDLGWHVHPYQRWQGGRSVGPSAVNLFDLALLDYPYGIVYEDSPTFDQLLHEYLLPAGLVRPIPYVRADWFVSVMTQPPFYEDWLRLPFDVHELEQRILGVDTEANLRDYRARRAGMTVSGVSRNNRVVERHPFKYGAYWKSFDFRSSKGVENMFRDPLDFQASGGEMIFNLPNGLQGYFVADNKGVRLEAAPTDIVTDSFAQDKVVRNGLACMRCHERGMKGFADTVRPALLRLPGSPGFDKRLALQLYPEQKEMDDLLLQDGDRFVKAMGDLLGKPLTREPLAPVSQRYLDDALHLGTAAGELGLIDAAGLQELFRMPQFANLGLVPLSAQGVVRRDAWEDYFDAVVRGLGLGIPIVPLDGVARRDFPSVPGAVQVVLKTNKKHNIFEPGDEMVLTVVNPSPQALWIELIGTSARGRKVILTPTPVQVAAGSSYRFPPQGSLKIRGGVGKEQITVFASSREFAGGELLRGEGVTDRVIHGWYQGRTDGGRWRLNPVATEVVKQTIDIETK